MRILNNGAELAKYFAQDKKKQPQGARIFEGIRIEGYFGNTGTAAEGKIDFREALNTEYRSMNTYKGEFRKWELVKGYKETYLANGLIKKIYKGSFNEGLLEDVNGMFTNMVNRTTKEGKFVKGVFVEGMYKVFSLNGDLIHFYKGKFKDGLLEDENGMYTDLVNRTVNEGRFVKGVFVEGTQKILSASGRVLRHNEGEFKDNALEKGVSTTEDATYEGLFNKGSFVYGEARFTNGITQIGFFNEDFTEGLKLFPEGDVWQGTFKEGDIQAGVYFSKEGIVQEGIFGDEELVDAYQADGKNTVIKVSDNVTRVGELEGTTFKMTSLVQFDVIYRGVFDEDERRFKSGTVTYPDGTVEEGTFNEKGLENGVTIRPLYESPRMTLVSITYTENNMPVFTDLSVYPKWQ